MITLIATQLMNLTFIGPLQHAGLALAVGLGACLNASLLFYKLRSHNIYQPQPGWFIFFFKILTALVIMGMTLWVATGNDASWLDDSAINRASRLAWVILTGVTSYFAALWLLGFRFKDFTRKGID